MKRRLALSLAALLLLGCLPPALAAEGDAELSLYQQYGPWGEWPQEQKDAAEETWTDGQWDDYWTEYDAQMWAALNRYNEDYDRWNYARFGDPWDEYLRVEKEEMGMPYPDGINVSLNGAYLDFGGTAPLAASGCTMVPFRAFLEGLGAEVAFDGSRIAAALENGDSLELVLGATELTVTQGGRITTLDMGAAPFVRDGHTYIPVRAAAEALGLDVYWDDTYEAAHLTDYAALTAELDSRFTAANGIWAAIRDTIPREAGKGYESTASMRLSATLYGEEEHDTASLTMEVKQLTRDGSYRMEQEQQVDLGGLGDTLFAGLSPEELAQLENHSVTLYDRESGTLYQKGVQLYSLEGEPLPDDVWVSTQVGELPAVNTLSLPGTLGELLVEAYGHSWYYYRSSPWETVMDSALPVRLLLDDGNFTRSASGGRTTYRWAVDLPALLERAVGEEAFADGFHYYYTEPRGLEDTEELLIYLPGAPLGELPQEFRGWVDHGDQGEALLSYALNNEAHQQGFFSRNLVREIIYSLISARDESGELEQQLQDATLSQEERETKAEELYQVWDNELNEVWDALNRLLSPEDMEVLTAEELEWIAWKEEQAALAGAGMAGALRAAELTRERVGVLEEYLETL